MNLTRCMRYWDDLSGDLSVLQLLVRRMGHLKKSRLQTVMKWFER